MAGETIGTAYVRIIANGDGLDRSVEREFKKSEPAIHKAGKRGADEFHDGYDEESDRRSKQTLKRLSSSITIGEKDFKKIGKGLSSDLWRGLEQDLEKRTKSHSIARLITANLQNDFRKLDGDFGKLGKHIEKNFTSLVADAGKELDRLGHDSERTTTHMGRMGASIDRTGAIFAKAFGKGARNNFFNLTGVIVGGITSAVGLIPKAIDGFSKLASGMSKVGEGGAEAAIGAEKAGASMAELAASGAAGVVALLAVGAAVSIAVSALVLLGGIVVALSGSIVFALVGALGALLGLLLPIGAAVGVLALAFVGLGNRTGAVHKQIMAFLKPVTSQLKELADVTRKHLFGDLAKDGENFGKGLKTLRPLVIGTADALSKMFSDVAKGAASPAFAEYIRTISAFVKTALPQLGGVIGNTFKGIGGVFEALIPLTQRFLDSMTRGSTAFSKFANGAEGQSKLQNFFKRAGDSAADLGHLLSATTVSLGKLLSAGKGSGDNIIVDLTKKVREFGDYLDAHPDSLKKFFGQSEKFAKALGGTILAIIHGIDELDNSASRNAVIGLFRDLNGIIENTARGLHRINVFFTDFATGVTGAFKTMTASVLGGVSGFLNGLSKIAGGLAAITPGKYDFGKGKIDAMKASVDKTITSLQNAAGGIDALNGKAQNLKVSADTKQAAQDLQDIVKTYNDVFGLPPGTLKLDSSDIAGASKVLKNLVDSYTVLKDKFSTPLKPIAIPDSLKNLSQHQLDIVNNQRVMAHLPPYEAKATSTDLTRVTQKQLALINNQAIMRGEPPINLKFNHGQVDLSDKATLGLINSYNKAHGLPQVNLKVNKSSMDAAATAARALQSLFRGLGGTTYHYVVLKRGKSVMATGGVMDGFGDVSRFALGGIANSQFNLRGNTVAEAGREAIVPLDRPLDQVDPSVRYLAAIAQGLNPGGGGTTVNNNLTVITPTKDPRAVAIEAANELAALGGY